MATKKVEFLNKKGEKLAAKLELPIDQKPHSYALFAHCFTCNKNLTAIRNIARSLIQSGIAVLRFDFTGLGESEGEFADTNFSSNIQDLLAAADYMGENLDAPKIIIGHSLGGAAAIFAGSQIDSIQAIATIGAPSNPAHVQHLFASGIDEIKKEGLAHLKIGGRDFTVKKQFLDDISEKNMKDVLSKLRKPILVMHSPQDDTVGINNASEIYTAAHHPKSFISLNGADHLLTDKDDSLYAGNLIANWATRYIDIPDNKDLKSNKQVAVRIGRDGYTTEIKAGNHNLIADEPADVGGNNFGPTPYDLLLSSLGACTAMTLRMYADHKGWDLEEVVVHMNHSKEYVEDIQACEKTNSKIDYIERHLEITGNLDDTQKKRLIEIADKCPVHKTLHSSVKVTTDLVE